jgi:hypothetical protein
MSSRPVPTQGGLVRETDVRGRISDPLARLLRLSFDVAALAPLVHRDAQPKVDMIVRELDEVIHDLRVRAVDPTAHRCGESTAAAVTLANVPTVPNVTRLPSGPDYPAPF